MTSRIACYDKEPIWAKEYFPGLLLFMAAILSMVITNSPFASGFEDLKHLKVGAGFLRMDIEHWIQDGLMAVFFLFVSLELKRELLDGVLSNPKRAALPVAASVGGTIIPALIYLAIAHQPQNINGWAIPAATDIAFSMGVLSLFGNRVPNLLKAFLLALAIVDDLAGVLIIAFGYTAVIVPGFLGLAMAIFSCMILFNRLGIRRLEMYWALGLLLWLAMLQSGVHPTIAGVLTAIAIPFEKGRSHRHLGPQPLIVAEHALRPAVQYFIMPLYAITAAGFAFSGFSTDMLTNPVSLGVFAGLLIGKPVGIMLFCLLFRALSRSKLDIPWMKLTGVACLAGIGFTMSLFIGVLAFDSVNMEEHVKIGVLAGSFLSALLGCVILDKALPKKGHRHTTSPAAPFLTRD